MPEPLILADRIKAGLTVLTLNRPEKRNALNISLLKAFCSQIEECQQERVVILNGAGPLFCSGLDLHELTDPHHEEESALLVTTALKMLYQAHFVTIAAVHGAAIAGGAGLMAACDIVIAADNLQCGFPEVRRGLVPAQISAILCRQLSGRHLRELLLTGEMFDAARALSLGLVNKVVPKAELQKEAFKQAELILKSAPGAISQTKQLLDELYPTPLLEDFDKTTPYHHRTRRSKEAIEGVSAFFEKRNPSWQG